MPAKVPGFVTNARDRMLKRIPSLVHAAAIPLGAKWRNVLPDRLS